MTQSFHFSKLPLWFRIALALAALLLLQWPLIFNPGYFSHDELQWWARAGVAGWRELPWVPWTSVADFQYRPLTFNLWLTLAHAFAATPVWMHLVFVALGSINALLLGACVRSAGATRAVATVAAIAFVLTPYAAYTHGWVGTLADVLVLMAGLIAFAQLLIIARGGDAFALRAAAVVLLTSLALLSKEAAVALPLAYLCALYRATDRRRVLGVVALTAALVGAYLIVRASVILGAPQGATAYAWTLGNIPRRLLEYALFPFMPPLLEIAPALAKSVPRLVAAGLCVAALLAALASRGARWPLVWCAMFSGLLAPVLILGVSYDHYAYLADAVAVGIAALAWSGLARWARFAVLFVAIVAAAHGIAIMLRMREVGMIQHTFYTDLVDRLDAGDSPIRLSVADEADRWMAARFLEGVPSWRGTAIEGRVHLIERDAPWQMRHDGHLVRVK